jgi:hypothetical protein
MPLHDLSPTDGSSLKYLTAVGNMVQQSIHPERLRFRAPRNPCNFVGGLGGFTDPKLSTDMCNFDTALRWRHPYRGARKVFPRKQHKKTGVVLVAGRWSRP